MTTLTIPKPGDQESVRVEFKTIYNLYEPNIAFEIAKDIAAMARAGGGNIWIGVEEDILNRVAKRIVPIDLEKAARIEERASQAVRDLCSVTIQFETKRFPVNGGFLIAIIIEPAEIPFGVRTSGERDAPYVFPMRVGTDTKYLVPDFGENIEARRIALQLASISTDEQVSFRRPSRSGGTDSYKMRKIEVDMASLTVEFSFPGSELREILKCRDFCSIQDRGQHDLNRGEARWVVTLDKPR